MSSKERKLAAPKETATKDAVANPAEKSPSPAESCSPAPRAVCVALPHSGRPVRVVGDKPNEFISTLHNSMLAWVNFTVSDLEKEGSEIATILGFSTALVPQLLKGHYASFEDMEKEIGIMVPVVKIKKLELQTYPLLILVRKDLIVTIHSEEVVRLMQFSRYADVYLRKLPETMPLDDKLTMMLVRILDENNSKNFEYLREIEEQGDEMSQLLLDPSSNRLTIGRQVYEIKHALITYLNTLWRTLDVLHSLRFGDAQLVSDNPKTLAKIGLLVEDVNRQIALSEHMSEVLASGLEVLQALYNNQLQIMNNRMALTMTWLTILGTAVLVPNTLATIFGFAFQGLSFNQLAWAMSVMTISTAGATYLAYWWVRRWVQLPKSPS